MAMPELASGMEAGLSALHRVASSEAGRRIHAVVAGSPAGNSDTGGMPAGEQFPQGWAWEDLAGRLVEFSGAPGTSGGLSAAMRWVAEAQRRGEPAAWVTSQESSFFPPDAAEGGIDLQSLVVVRVPELAEVARAAEALARSGAFGLVVLDLVQPAPGSFRALPVNPAPPLLNRLQGVARAQDAVVLFITEKDEEELSIGPLVSLRTEVSLGNRCMDSGEFILRSRVLKNKSGPIGVVNSDLFCAPCGV